MTDPDSPAFPVVDRRRSAQPTEPTLTDETPSEPDSTHGSKSNVPADTTSTNPDANPASEQNTIHNQDSFADTSLDTASTSRGASASSETQADSEADNDMPAPDPGALLAYVAMQMDVKSLSAALLGIFSGHAWRAMGLVANPVTGQTEKDLPEARIAIDCVQFLFGKLETELSAEERREMQRRLNDLRVNYLAKMQEK